MTKNSVVILGILFGCIFLFINPVHADHYDAVFEQHEQCLDDCEETRERGLAGLDCDYYGTQSAYQACERNASSARLSCNNRCNATEDETISNCKSGYRSDKKECRVEKRDETRECKDSKKAEKEICKQNKIDEKEACRGLSGNAKRECKKQARQNKKDCKKQARETKKACKRDARDNKKICKDSAKTRRDSCITTAENVARDCRSVCTDVYNSACVEEHQAYDACSVLADPIFSAEQTCREVCDDVKEEDLEGYNPSCRSSGGHAGEQGARLHFYNGSGEVRHYYRPEPYPETQPTGPLSLPMEYVTSLDPGETYVQDIICGVGLSFHFKRHRTDGVSVGTEFNNIGPYPCCENVQEIQLNIISNGR